MILKTFKILKLIKSQFDKDLRSKSIVLIFNNLCYSLLEFLNLILLIPIIEVLSSDKESTYLNLFFDYFTGSRFFQYHQKIIIYIIIFFLFILIKVILFNFIVKYNLNLLFEIKKHFQLQIFNKILTQNLDNLKSSKIIKFLTTDSEFLFGRFLKPINSIFQATISLLAMLSVIVFYNAMAVFVILLISAIIVLFFKIFKSSTKNWSKLQRENVDNQISIIQEYSKFRGQIKIYNLEIFFKNKFLTFTHKINNYGFKIFSRPQIIRNNLEFFLTSGILVLLIVILIFDKNNTYDLSSLLILLYALIKSLPYLNSILSGQELLRSGVEVLLSFYNEILQIKPVSSKEQATYKFQSFNLKEGYLSYINNKLGPWNLNFNLGDKILLTGPSGVGKTSLVECILGLRGLSQGEKYFTYNSKQHLNLDYAKIGYCEQSSFFLNETIKNNILLFRDDISDKDFKDILKTTELNDFIENLEDKENTVINEKGNNFSGGQLQRIAIARSIINKPTLLILDESTSGLQKDLEKKIIQNIFKFLNESTIILLSHQFRSKEIFNKQIKLS
jgi:ABC-type multidrug transport system fused ATPase/permease subunit